MKTPAEEIWYSGDYKTEPIGSDDTLRAMGDYATQFMPVWVSIMDGLPKQGEDVLAIDTEAGFGGRQVTYEVVTFIGLNGDNSWQTIGY